MGEGVTLTDEQRRAIRAGMYVPRYPSDPAINHAHCRVAVHGRRQCTATAKVRHPSGYMVCRPHERAGGLAFPWGA
ncbi:MAG TPA: hypothetical protein VEB59_14575 [Gemmatimonadales bacterium]|nr:hypothetical protein [Gemmatimonadales bacterium]